MRQGNRKTRVHGKNYEFLNTGRTIHGFTEKQLVWEVDNKKSINENNSFVQKSNRKKYQMVTTSRRERPPSGKVLDSRISPRKTNSTFAPEPETKDRYIKLPSGRKNEYRPNTAFNTVNQKVSARIESDRPESATSTLVSNRSDEELSTNEVLRRMREKSELAKKARDEQEISMLGPYNAFSRPRSSMVVPLRSVFLDPSVNNFPPSRTRTELMKRIRFASMPHPSYDLDSDGYVSNKDYKLAKRFDFDGNGVLDPDERQVGRRVLAEEFFRRHAKDLHNFGPSFSSSTHKQNVEKLLSSHNFERSYEKLTSVERTLAQETSKPVLDCIRNDDDEIFQKCKYFTNKFDSTAWTDMDRLPRPVILGMTQSTSGKNNSSESEIGVPNAAARYGGSRRRLLFEKQEALRAELQARMSSTIVSSFRRTASITDPRVENS